MDYIVVDALWVQRETFAAIIEAWRDGYAEIIGEKTPITRTEAIAYFHQMIATIRDPRGYAVWMVPVSSGRVGWEEQDLWEPKIAFAFCSPREYSSNPKERGPLQPRSDRIGPPASPPGH